MPFKRNQVEEAIARIFVPNFQEPPLEELAERDTSMTAANDLPIRRALEFAGVDFIDENGGGRGVRLRKRQRARAQRREYE